MRVKAFAVATLLYASMAPLAQDQSIRIHAATAIDGTGKVLRNATLVVQGSKITAIETTGTGAASYDLGRLTVMPGMIDVHSHIGWHFGKDGRADNRGETPAQQ